jgi:hypothetical protein
VRDRRTLSAWQPTDCGINNIDLLSAIEDFNKEEIE